MKITHAGAGSLRLLQAIRCVAALVVVWHHTDALPQFGHFGVDLFFVLSGCVMAMLMARMPTASEFFLRRVVRVWPMYALATFALLLATLAMPSARRAGLTFGWSEILQSLCFIPYENSRGELFPFLSVGWTLTFEMVFYLCCAAALAVSKRYAWIVAGTLALGLLFVARTFDLGVAGQFFANPIILEFVVGLIIWQLWSACQVHGQRLTLQLGMLGALAVFALPLVEMHTDIIFAPGSTSWSRPFAFLPLVSLVIYAALALERNVGEVTPRWLALPARIGDASYSIYLTHMFIVGLLFKLGPSVFGKTVAWPPLALAAVALSTFVGIVVHEYIDAPLQRRLRGVTFLKAPAN